MLKKNLRIILIYAFSVLAITNSARAQGYELKIKVNGLKDTLCYLANYYGDKQYIKDSAMVNSTGNITFKGSEPLAGGIHLRVCPNKTYFEIMVDKTQSFSMECDQNDAINTMKIKGSQENTDFYNYLQFIQKKSIEMETLKSEKTRAAAENKPIDAISAKIPSLLFLVIKAIKEVERTSKFSNN